ncbi:MAG: FAD-binding protein [Actinobacteria bacterium]|jgi:flavin-dependent dehydrogenase|nr:MAG: FAD-binding protein [Actinomycetota bacterium]
MPDKYDVVIVGAGPAGAAAAKALSGSGLKTAILEKQPLPRYKMCSGILFPAALKFINDVFGEVPPETRCEPQEVIGLRGLLSLGNLPIDLPFSAMNAIWDDPDLPRAGLSIKRPELDLWLCRRSDASIVDNCALVALEQGDEKFVLRVNHAGEEKEIETRFLVGADGPNSRVRRTTFSGFDRAMRLIPNYEEWYLGEIDLEPGWLYLFFDRGLSGFMATIFQKDGVITAVTGAAKGESARSCFRAFRDHLEREHGLRVKETLSRHGIVLNDMSATGNYCLGEGRTLLAGEAAGFLRSAEGITPALFTGMAAGEAILKSVESGRPAMDFYAPATATEMERCRMVHKLNEDVAGFNMFTRE